MTVVTRKNASHEHAKCARRRGESVVFENVHAVEARAPFWPLENNQKTDEVFKVLLQNERFA